MDWTVFAIAIAIRRPYKPLYFRNEVCVSEQTAVPESGLLNTCFVKGESRASDQSSNRFNRGWRAALAR